jgi:uncharacterized protein
MKIILTRKNELEPNTWSGGTTTQLAIFPSNSTLQERNFRFRVSTATVDAEESVFTSLPGVHRILMILDGEIFLEHTGHYSRTLKRGETDNFPGEWETRSRGRAIDFNLMTTGNIPGMVELVGLPKGEELTLSLEQKRNVTGIYLLKGLLHFRNPIESETLRNGDFLLVFRENEDALFTLQPADDCEFVCVTIDCTGADLPGQGSVKT